MIGALLGLAAASVVMGVVLDRHRRRVEAPAEELERESAPRSEKSCAPDVAQLPAQLLAQLPSEKSCAVTVEQVPKAPDPDPVARKLRGPPPSTGPPPANTRSKPRVVVGIRPDGGTTFAVAVTPSSWSPELRRLRAQATAAQRSATILGQAVVYRVRGVGAGEVFELHAPGRFRLQAMGQEARLIVEARAMDLGGIIPWGRNMNWASRCLGVGECTGLLDAARAGWRLVELPLCADFAGVVLRLEDERRERWVGVRENSKINGHPGADGELATLYIGGKKAGLYVRLYCKSGELGHRKLFDSTLHQRWREAGWDGEEPVLRVEVVLREKGLALRPRAEAEHEGLGFRDPAILADAAALARLWAHCFGHPEEPQSGRYRLIVEATGEVDPRWLLVQAVAAEAPLERLAQVRERRRAERRARRAQAEQRWVKSVGEVARFDGLEPGVEAETMREHMAARTRQLRSEVLTGTLERAEALYGDLFEEGPDP